MKRIPGENVSDQTNPESVVVELSVDELTLIAAGLSLGVDAAARRHSSLGRSYEGTPTQNAADTLKTMFKDLGAALAAQCDAPRGHAATDAAKELALDAVKARQTTLDS